MAQKIRIGDIIEIPTKKGLVYAQYTHEHSEPPHYGSLIRICSGFYNERPKDFSIIAKSDTLFHIFVPLQASVNANLVEIVSNETIPTKAKKIPVFRGGLIEPKINKVLTWWFWDGKKEWKVGEITKEQRKIPILSIVTVPCLVEKIESGWTPETDPF